MQNNRININSYSEWWRDWPYEARQPAVTNAKVPIPAKV